jgi:glucose/arabinose dehydrogenase
MWRSGGRSKVLGTLCAFLAGAILLAAGGGGAQAAGTLGLRLVGNFDHPVYITGSPSGGLYIVEKTGYVRLIRRGKVQPTPFLDLHRLVRVRNDQGLESIAFPRDYKQHGKFYVAFTNRHCLTQGRCNLEVDEFRRSTKNPRVADPASRRPVIEITHDQGHNHYGGMLQFGNRYQLYISTGDGGCCRDPFNNSQNKEVLLGKLLRIDPRKHGISPYLIPPDNPFVGQAGREEVYSYGLRNPFRFSIDPTNGFLAIGDVGESQTEEFDYLSMAAASGANFGWSCKEGNQTFRSDQCFGGPMVDPVFTYPHSGIGGSDGCAITGGYVVRFSALPSLEGRYIYADLCKGDIHSLDPNPGIFGAGDTATGLHVEEPVGFGVDRSHNYFVVSIEGPIYRLVER